jgi:prophage regulatory protein
MAKAKRRTPKTPGPDPLADDRILDPQELLERIPLDRSTVYRMVQEGRFPPPIRLTAFRIGWRWSAILAWLAEREANPVTAASYFGREKDKPTATTDETLTSPEKLPDRP